MSGLSRGGVRGGGWSTLPHQLQVSGIAALAAWVTVLSWRVLTAGFAEVGIPLLFIGAVLAGGGAVARWSRVPGVLVVLAQLVVGALLVLGTTTGSPLPTPANVDLFLAMVRDALDSSRQYAAPVQAGVPPVHPLLLIGGTLVLVAVDAVACTLRRAPVAGLVLLAAYTLPVAVTGESVSWWLFVAIAGLFLVLVFLQHSDHVASWGRAPDGERGAFSVRTGAISNTAVALGGAAIALAVVVPAAVPTMSMSVYDGNGPGTREVTVNDPMVDLRRDLAQGADVPLLWVTTSGPKPSYLRISVLTRFNGQAWTPGDREIPDDQSATGVMPPLDGVSTAVRRKDFQYDVRVGPDFDSTWLPTTEQVSRISAGSEWRYDVNTRDFIAARDDITTADSSYDFTGVQLTYDEQQMNDAVSGAGSVAGIFTDVPPSLNNEIRRLAQSVTADAPTRFQKAQVLQRWFREDGGFRYDKSQVESAGSGGADLLAFLDDKVGYCEQFAASMAIMARVLGIPSRVAVGFLEPTRATNGAWEFSSHDLHAWPELYFPGSGWVRFEPTPQARAGQVPGYTTAEIAPVSQAPSPSVSRSSELLPERGETASAATGTADEESSSVPWVPLLAGLGGLALLSVLLLTPRLVRASRRQRRLAGDVEDLWVELQDVTRDLGHDWPHGRSPRRTGEWLGRLLARPTAGGERPDRPRRGRDQAPEAAAALDRLVHALEHSRYSREPEAFTAERFRADAELVEQALAAGVTPREVRRAAWWPASVVGRRRSWRPRSRTAPPPTPTDPGASRPVDELVG
ncbi:transglutaminase family protein [Nocardioides zeicaulis]|uniref:TransglutaminaseTgpA domain-containing protein n=1 Tax=Nocardioides zeicaulis TaxID=1776857 RepID=A0ABV6DX41_9ACTN